MLHSPRAKVTRAICQLLYVMLLVLLVVTTFWPSRNPEVSLLMVLTIKLLPLIIFVPVLLSGDNRGLIWLSFVIIFYFTQFVVSAWLTEGALGATLSAVVALLLFVFAMVHLKVNRSA
jgi:uncharacterized membrane protein